MELPREVTDELYDMLVECPHCGFGCSLLAVRETHRRQVILPPGVTPPHHSLNAAPEFEAQGGTNTWDFAPKKKLNFFILFSGFWLLITGIVTSGFLFGKGESNVTPVFLGLFLSAFWLIGLGLLYVGLRIALIRQRLELTSTELIYEKILFGRHKRIVWPRESVHTVVLKEFYQQNYKPVHGIEIRGAQGKIRFGSMLGEVEKSAVVEQLRSLLGMASPDAEPLVETTPIQGLTPPPLDVTAAPGESLRIDVPGYWNKPLLMIGIIFAAMGSFMLTMGLTFVSDFGSPEAPVLFKLISGGFMLFWCSGVGSFALIGFALIYAAYRSKRVNRTLEVNRFALTVSESTRQQTVQDTWKLSELKRALLVPVGKLNERMQWRGEIIVPQRVIPFGYGQDPQQLQKLVDEINAILSRAKA
jgi:hypothetical protein